MSREYTADQISRALFETDPLNTCCRENECWDEYDHVAQAIYVNAIGGDSLEKALEQAIREWFYDGESVNTNILQQVLAQLEKLQ